MKEYDLLLVMLKSTRCLEAGRIEGGKEMEEGEVEREEEGKAAGDEICEIKAWVGNHM